MTIIAGDGQEQEAVRPGAREPRGCTVGATMIAKLLVAFGDMILSEIRQCQGGDCHEGVVGERPSHPLLVQ